MIPGDLESGEEWPAAGDVGFTPENLAGLIGEHTNRVRDSARIRVHHDTTNYLAIDYDDVLILRNHPFLIRHNEKEGRFGIDEQPKFWVRRAISLLDGRTRVIKMVFHEQFMARIGEIVFNCVRSPGKEARILELVRGHSNFMQGYSVMDPGGNIVRVLDFIKGRTLEAQVLKIPGSHEIYFHEFFPTILDKFIEISRAVDYLHQNGEKHGDVRRDHILLDQESGTYRLIDFDYNYAHGENIAGYDLFGLGNVLGFIVGRGDVTMHEINRMKFKKMPRFGSDDFNIVFNNRLSNLHKVFPYIPATLNDILLHFSRGSRLFYENVDQFLEDIMEYRDKI